MKKHHILFYWNLTRNLPKIALRVLCLLFLNKRLRCTYFKANAVYCVNGTLNQLLWNVENSIFITLNNSSKLFFDSGEVLFRVWKGQTTFQLTAYGITKKQRLRTEIKVINLEKQSFFNNEIALKNIAPNFKKAFKVPYLITNLLEYNQIFFQKIPKTPKVNIQVQQSDILKNQLSRIFKVETQEELNHNRALSKKY